LLQRRTPIGENVFNVHFSGAAVSLPKRGDLPRGTRQWCPSRDRIRFKDEKAGNLFRWPEKSFWNSAVGADAKNPKIILLDEIGAHPIVRCSPKNF